MDYRVKILGENLGFQNQTKGTDFDYKWLCRGSVQQTAELISKRPQNTRSSTDRSMLVSQDLGFLQTETGSRKLPLL
jgi:hypothetical protein